MNCEDLQLSLSLYSDGLASPEEEAAVDSHLTTCPLCRQKLDDYRALRADLRQLSNPVAPIELTSTVKTAVRTEIVRTRRSYFGGFSPNLIEFLKMQVMPYAVATASAIVIGLTLLWMLLSNANVQYGDLASRQEFTPIFMPPTPTTSNIGDTITPSGLAAERLSVSGESPSINPQGALIALTKSLARGHMKDDEVVVVADVFSDGLASVEEIVVPLDDSRALLELEKALGRDSEDAPFVPAVLDKRADSVRVVLKIQRVNVRTNLPRKK